MNLDDAFKELRKRNQRVPKPLRLPTEAEVAHAEYDLEIKFHPDYRRFQLEVSDVVYGVLEPSLVLPNLMPYLDLRVTARDGWDMGVPKDSLSFCTDNGNFYFIDALGVVRYWDHDSQGESGRRASLSEWIIDDWLFDYE